MGKKPKYTKFKDLDREYKWLLGRERRLMNMIDDRMVKLKPHLKIVNKLTLTASSNCKNTVRAKNKDVSTARVAILPTKTFGIFFPNTPLINPPINGSAIINGMSC